VFHREGAELVIVLAAANFATLIMFIAAAFSLTTAILQVAALVTCNVILP
jgi:hypothetical protein